MKKPISMELLAKIFAADYVANLLRYLLIAGGVFLLFYVWRRQAMRPFKIQKAEASRNDMRREVLYSLCSMAIFALVGVGVFLLHRHGWLHIYGDFKSRGWGYLAFSVVVLILAHDTYFYWTHRLMHWKPLFPLVHRIHHLSHTPTPWAAFSFHPIEAFVQAGVFPLVAVFMPLHPLAALIWLLYMTGMNALGHSGFELMPAGFVHRPVLRWYNTTLHHDMHHRQVHCNYGLYFNIWDQLMGTNHKNYEAEFDALKARSAQSEPVAASPVAQFKEVQVD